MNKQAISITEKIERLLTVLEKEIGHLERTSQYLNDLRGLVIKRNEQGLGRLLEQIKAQTEQYRSIEQNRQLIREQLAEQLDCDQAKLTLSVLKNALDEPQKTAVGDKQIILRNLVRRLQGEYSLTVSLLSNCARINRTLLKAVFGRGQAETVLYDSSGAMARRPDAAFMNMRL